MSELITASETTLAALLRGGRFSVPRHQRYYDWEVEHVDTLLHDLADAVNEKSRCHFLGSVMLINSDTENRWEINDGQQRIITFSLICAYLCRIFAQENLSANEEHAMRILYDLPEAHGKRLQDANQEIPRILPPKNNKANFNSLIRGHNVGTNGKMIAAWKKIVSFFEETEHQQSAWLQDLFDFMLKAVIVVRLEVDQQLDSNAIFETLNSRGKQVGQMDLIKNHFLQSFKSDSTSARTDTVNDNFEKIYTAFKGNVDFVAEYVRCYMQAEMGFINKERFLKETKKRFRAMGANRRDKIFDLVGMLADNAGLQAFKTFHQKSANQSFLDKLTKDARKTNAKRKIRDYLLDMHEYKITRPITFALLLSYSNAPEGKKTDYAQTAYQCAKLLASFMQRVSHVGDFKPVQYEEKFANLAKSISCGKCDTDQKFFDELKSFDIAGVINDSHYIEKMKVNFSLRSDKKFAYIIKRIAENREKGVHVADNQTSIEHILPQSPEHNAKSAWAAFSPDERQRLSRALGNLTVLAKGEDSPKAKDNESFAAKKKLYEKSTYKLTKEIFDRYDSWTPDDVKTRQQQLVREAAKEIWNFR